MRLSTAVIILVVVVGIGATIVSIGSEIKARQADRLQRITELTKE